MKISMIGLSLVWIASVVGQVALAQSPAGNLRYEIAIGDPTSGKVGGGQIANAARKFTYHYAIGSLRPSADSGGYGMEGMMGGMMGGGDGMMGGYGGMAGGEGGYGDGGYGAGGSGYGGSEGGGYGGAGGMGMGGMGGYAGGGYGGDDYGMSGGHHINLVAFVAKRTNATELSKIEIVVRKPEQAKRGAGGMGGSGGGAGASAGGGAGGGDEGGSGSRSRRAKSYVRVVAQAENSPAHYFTLPPAEYQIVINAIRLEIWKDDLIRSINVNREQPDVLDKIEVGLRNVLIQDYENQQARQEYEVARIEERVAALRADLSRRAAAKERVVDVQLGRIVLEAQGLLSR